MKWIITDSHERIGNGKSATKIYRIRHKNEKDYQSSHVWVNFYSDGTLQHAACTCCSTPLSAMSGSCVHARTVLRFVKKEIARCATK